MNGSIFSGNNTPNPIFNFLGGFNNFRQNFATFAQQFNQNNSKTPEQVVRELVSSGRMSQEQFNQFSIIANQITGRK